MTEPMAIRAEEVALPDFLFESRRRATELTDCEQLRRRIAVVELQSSNRTCVATVHATTPCRFDQLLLAALPSPLLGSISLRILLPATCLREVVQGQCANRKLRRVVHPKGRTFEAEAPTVEGAHLAIDDRSNWEGTSALFAHFHRAGAYDGLPRLVEMPQGLAVETELAAVQVEPHAIDYGICGEVAAAA